MGYGCLACLAVVESIAGAYPIDTITYGVSLKDKLLNIIPGLVTNVIGASLCVKCADFVNTTYEFKKVVLESQNKIFTFLETSQNAKAVVVEDIAKWYKQQRLSDYGVPISSEDSPTNFARELDAQPSSPKVLWEPPPPINDDDNAAVFKSAPDDTKPALKLKCKFCTYSCDENCMHAFHMILHATPDPPYNCGRCPTVLQSKELLLDHLARHTSEDPYKCTICFFQTNRYKRMKLHQDLHLLPFYCPICKERFRYEKEMRKHQKEIHRSKLKCNMCRYQSNNQVLLAQHRRDHRTCKTCGQTFDTMHDIDEHCKKHGHVKRIFQRY